MTGSARWCSRLFCNKVALNVSVFDTLVSAPELSLRMQEIIPEEIPSTYPEWQPHWRLLCSGDVGYVAWYSPSYTHVPTFVSDMFYCRTSKNWSFYATPIQNVWIYYTIPPLLLVLPVARTDIFPELGAINFRARSTQIFFIYLINTLWSPFMDQKDFLQIWKKKFRSQNPSLGLMTTPSLQISPPAVFLRFFGRFIFRDPKLLSRHFDHPFQLKIARCTSFVDFWPIWTPFWAFFTIPSLYIFFALHSFFSFNASYYKTFLLFLYT